jgi:hypothetical protein
MILVGVLMADQLAKLAVVKRTDRFLTKSRQRPDFTGESTVCSQTVECGTTPMPPSFPSPVKNNNNCTR